MQTQEINWQDVYTNLNIRVDNLIETVGEVGQQAFDVVETKIVTDAYFHIGFFTFWTVICFLVSFFATKWVDKQSKGKEKFESTANEELYEEFVFGAWVVSFIMFAVTTLVVTAKTHTILNSEYYAAKEIIWTLK